MKQKENYYIAKKPITYENSQIENFRRAKKIISKNA